MDDSPLTIKPFVDAMFAENAFVVSARNGAGGQVGWVIDPGLGRQPELLIRYARERQIVIEKIILTHGHADHIAGVDAVHEAWPTAGVLIGGPDEPMLADPNQNLSALFGFNLVLKTPASGHLEPGMELVLGKLQWSVLDTSGHSPGGRSLHCPEAGVVFTGDALFSGGIGRTDFPGADGGQLIGNIRKHLLTLPGDTAVYSGHGPVTTVRIEQKSNPFLADAY